ncbi:MAG: hypothetical protein F6K17_43190 [Okeania sp. SIO3C4]|nr:hypothetical protein [Okeania sp. SIO3C4]
MDELSMGVILGLISIFGSVVALVRTYYTDNSTQTLAIERVERRLERLEIERFHDERYRNLRLLLLSNQIKGMKHTLNDISRFLQSQGFHARIVDLDDDFEDGIDEASPPPAH